MSIKFITPNARVEITNKLDSTTHISTVKDVLERGRILLDVMRVGGKEVRLPTRDDYALRIICEAGIYKFPAELKGYVRKGHFEYLMFQVTGEGEKIQRRQQYRLSCAYDVEYGLSDGVEPAAAFETGMIRDISSGGVKLVTKQELDGGQLIQLKLPMVLANFWVYGVVLTKNEIPEAKYKFQYGIELIGVTEAGTDKIAAFVHAEQFKARARK